MIALKTVDRIRKVLAGNDISTARVHAREWLNSIGASPKEVETLLEAKDTDTLRSRLQTSSPLQRLTEQSTQAGRAAAWQVLTATAVSPWPGLDGVIVVWRGLRLVRQVAGFHGLRPGALGTLRLLQRVMLDAGTVAAAELAVATLGDALLTSPVGGALAGQATGSAIAARRMLRLSFAVAQSCRPLP